MRRQALERQFTTWVDRIGDVLLHPGCDFPIREILDGLTSSFQARTAWNWRDADGSLGVQQHDPVPGWPPPDQLEYWAREGLSRHPLVRWFTVTGELSAMTMGRVPPGVVGRSAFQDVRAHLRPFSLEQQLSIPYRFHNPMYRAFVVAQSGPDFHLEQLMLARRIQPLLVLLDRQSTVLGQGEGIADRVHGAAAQAGLTGREVAVLRLLAAGGTAVAIGHGLGISPKTVQVHLNHIYKKLGVNDRLLAISVARELGLLPVRTASRHTWPATRPDSPHDRLGQGASVSRGDLSDAAVAQWHSPPQPR